MAKQATTTTKKSFPFQVSDESVNDYGFRILTAGGDLSFFLKNPVALKNHDCDDLNIGKWADLKTEGTVIKANYLPLEGDKDVDKLVLRLEDGTMGASIGFEVLETSRDPKLMLAGQKLPTVTKWILREISILNLGSNRNAVQLYSNEGKRIDMKSIQTLSSALTPTNKLSNNQNSNTNNNNMKNFLIFLASVLG